MNHKELANLKHLSHMLRRAYESYKVGLPNDSLPLTPVIMVHVDMTICLYIYIIYIYIYSFVDESYIMGIISQMTHLQLRLFTSY